MARLQDVARLSLPSFSNYMWESSCPFSSIRNVLLIRYSQLWTSARAAARGLLYASLPPSRPPGSCPLCPCLSDTTGHLLGGCTHPTMHALYIHRHNSALRLICNAILQGALANSLIILDACSQHQLPPGVYATRLPRWLLPSLPSLLRTKLRPDLLLIEGLSHSAAPPPDASLSPGALATLQRLCTLHILELGYCHDSRYPEQFVEKQLQHVELLTLLHDAGWRLSSPLLVHTVLLGTSGTLFVPLHAALLSFGLSPPTVPRLLHSLHLHAVTSAHTIVRTRRFLEARASTGPILPPDPP